MGSSDDDHHKTEREASNLNDPVYGQEQPSPATNTGPARTNATGAPDHATDPVYSQSSTSTNGESSKVNDPVYGQIQQPPSIDKGPVRTKASGAPDHATDPVYSQSSEDDHPKTDRESSKVNDPVYGQEQPSPSTDTGPARTKASGAPDHATDPVYSQSPSSSTPSTTATSRLNQISSQISPPSPSEPSSSSTTNQPNTTRPRRKPKSKKPSTKDAASTLPSDYSDILCHINSINHIVANPDPTSRGYSRQLQTGKLWSRTRISRLLDPNTWHEIGSLTGTATWSTSPSNPQSENLSSFIPSNNPQGFGTLTTTVGQKRRIYLTSDDFTLRAGHADGGSWPRSVHGEKLALHYKIPVVKLVDGSSGGGSVTSIKTTGYAYLPHANILGPAVVQMNKGIPNIGAVVGPAIGLGAARVVSTHFSVMAADIGSLFNAGPKVVEGATFEEGLSFQDLGGPGVHCTNGTIDNLAPDEEGCFNQIRTVLGYLPDCGELQAPPTVSPCEDDVNREDLGLRSIIPRRKARMYNPFTIIESVVDKGSWFEIGGLWGRTAITGLARLGGRPVGILSLNCEVNSGALDAGGSQKMLKMIKFCDIFNLPIVQFVDVPGYAIGTVAERSATMKWGVELGKTYYASTTPIFSVVTRRVFGVAGGVMLDNRDPIMRVAWPSGQWGSLPLEGGIEVGHRFELKQIREKEGVDAEKARYKELEDEYLRLMNPVRTANIFGLEEIIDPKDTRKIVCGWVEQMYGKNMLQRLADRASGKLHVTFT